MGLLLYKKRKNELDAIKRIRDEYGTEFGIDSSIYLHWNYKYEMRRNKKIKTKLEIIPRYCLVGVKTNHSNSIYVDIKENKSQ